MINVVFFPELILSSQFEGDPSNFSLPEKKEYVLNILKELEKNNNFKYYQDLYEKEKEKIKNEGYEIFSSYVTSINNIFNEQNSFFSNFIFKFVKKHKIKSVFQIDLILNSKINLFLEKKFREKDKIFIIKSHSMFDYLSVENVKMMNFDFCFFNFDQLKENYVEKKILLNQVKNKIRDLDFDCEIFVLSDGFFSINKKSMTEFLLKVGDLF